MKIQEQFAAVSVAVGGLLALQQVTVRAKEGEELGCEVVDSLVHRQAN